MNEQSVNDTDKAYAYILDCNLATVSRMAMLKSRKVGEYRRQIAIAQKMLDWAVMFNIDVSTTRGDDVLRVGTVKKWADQQDPGIIVRNCPICGKDVNVGSEFVCCLPECMVEYVLFND